MGKSVKRMQVSEDSEKDASEYDLYIEIESVDSEGNCLRPVDDVCLCSSSEESVVEDMWAEIQNFKEGDWERVQEGETEYTVYIYKTNEDDSIEFHEEWSLGRYLSLEKAKEFMGVVVKKFLRSES